MQSEDIQLRQEVYRQDVERMAEWMGDDEVTAYLNEEQDVQDTLKRTIRSAALPIFSAQFNRNGSFFMIVLTGHGPIGFLRLIPKPEGAEIVVVIGERSQWGKGYGLKAIKKGIRRVFFDWREDKVIAKIHKENTRSLRVFRKAGFTPDEHLTTEVKYSLDLEDYL
ncbi:MAG TPA: GNAT family N-acetyltransferase [bacterium]|nr:GNAT family N-acetyltransferase [bacterium]